jgi:hypothetical protein
MLVAHSQGHTRCAFGSARVPARSLRSASYRVLSNDSASGAESRWFLESKDTLAERSEAGTRAAGPQSSRAAASEDTARVWPYPPIPGSLRRYRAERSPGPMCRHQVPLERIHPDEPQTFGTLTLVNTTARPLAARLTAFPTLGRVSLPSPARNRAKTPPGDSSSALFTQKGESAHNGTGEALQAGGTRKRRDRTTRRWKPGGKGERIEHREQEREQLERRRQQREQQQGICTLSKTQPRLSPSALSGNARQAGGGYAVERRERMHNAHDAAPYQEHESAHPATLRALDPGRCSSTESSANLAPSFPSPVGLPSIPPSNAAGLVGYVPERSQRERFGSGSGLATVELWQTEGGHRETGLARLLGRVAAPKFAVFLPVLFGGLAS